MCIYIYIYRERETYIYIYIYIHTYIHTYMHACMHACIHTYIHTYEHIHMFIYIYIHTYYVSITINDNNKLRCWYLFARDRVPGIFKYESRSTKTVRFEMLKLCVRSRCWSTKTMCSFRDVEVRKSQIRKRSCTSKALSGHSHGAS